MIALATLTILTRSRWSMPILAMVARDGGARFAALTAQLGVSRSMLSTALAALQQQGWLTRNPGHGHPLRPEYILTGEGRPIAAWCLQLIEQRRKLGLEPDALNRWSLPVVAELGVGWERFSALQNRLRPVTPRALSLTLKQMVAADLVGRRLEDGFPPHSLYGLTGRGRDLAQAMAV